MATEIKQDQFVPQSLRLPPPVGTSPIWKLSLELLLNIAEYLDIHSCLTLSQTCRTLFFLSTERTVFWRSAKFAYGLLPRVAAISSFSGKELRGAAVKSINLEWRWEKKPSPSLTRRTHVPILYTKEKYWIPHGSRWLFRTGTDKSVQKQMLSIYDLLEEKEVGSMELKSRVIRIEGASLAPNRVVFIVQLDGSSTIPVHIVDFTPLAVFRTFREINAPAPVVRCTLQDGIVALSTAEEIVVEKWEDGSTRRTVHNSLAWEPRGLQVARDRLIFLERKRDQEVMKTWQIKLFDISGVRNKESSESQNGLSDLLKCTCTGLLPHFPHEPFYAPYWEERREDSGLHLGFKTVILMHTVEGEYFWHIDFTLDVTTNEEGVTEETLNIEVPRILGACPSERATYFVDAHALGASAGRLVWIASNGMARIFSEWTDEGSNSRVLDLKCKPATIPRVLAFDEKLGVLMLSDTEKNTAVFWFA